MNGVPMTMVPEAMTATQRKRIKDRFPHAIFIPPFTRRVARQELTSWCEGEFGPRNERWFHALGSDEYRFVAIADAMMFKLRWC